MASEVSTEILAQLGGQRALLMLGTPRRDGVTHGERSLSVRYRGGKRGPNRFTIRLVADDTYTVAIEHHRPARLCTRSSSIKPEKTLLIEFFEGVQVGQLRSTIENAIEMRLSL